MTEQEFKAEAKRRIEAFLATAGYAAHGTVEMTRAFVYQVLGLEPDEPETVPTDAEGAE